eukprot:COSAG02_NODE_480_length_21469_cov_13.479551_3_plen_453_part_00
MRLRRGALSCTSLFVAAATAATATGTIPTSLINGRVRPTSLHLGPALGSPPLDPPLCPARQSPTQSPTHTTLGFITSPNSTEWLTNYCWSQLTHVAWCHLELAATGDLTPAWDPGYWSSVPQLVDHIHQAPWTRVLLTVAMSGHQYSPGENKTKTLLDRSHWPTFFAAIAQRIHEADADGVMFDIEHIDHVPGGLAAYSALVLQTAAHLRKQPRPPGRPVLQTMLCTVQYPRVLKMNYTALANGLDALFLMDYNDHGIGSPYAGPVTQLHSTAARHPPPTCTKDAGYGNLPGIDGLLAQWAALGVPRNKMILGLPWFGGEWPVAAEPGFAPIKGAQPVGLGMATCGGAGCGWNSLYVNQLADPATQKYWDECMEQPWYNRQNSTGGWVQGWFDNRTSLVRKYERAKQAGLQGVGIWLLGYGTMPLGAPLWHSLADSFTPSPRHPDHKTDDNA